MGFLDFFENVIDTVKEKAGEAADIFVEAAGDVKGAVGEAIDFISDTAGDVVDGVSDAAGEAVDFIGDNKGKIAAIIATGGLAAVALPLLPFLSVPMLAGGTIAGLTATITVGTTTIVVAGIATLVAAAGISCAFLNELEKRETDGFKKGCESASSEYLEKLSKQANEFIKQFGEFQKNQERSEEVNKQLMSIIESLFSVSSKLEGCIQGLRDKGYSESDLKDALEQLNVLKKIKEEIKKGAK